MATIYRFIIEQKATTSGDGRKPTESTSKNTTAKKGRAVSIFGGGKGGVEHNRKMRAINPMLNIATHGAYEKGMRLGRAAAGLVQVNSETGKFAGLSWTAIAIIISFIIQTFNRTQMKARANADRSNNNNFRRMENGQGAVHGAFDITADFYTGRLTYNENK